jgi:predicted ATPase
LAEPSSKNVVEALPSDGEGLPTLLGLLKLQNFDRFQEIVRQLREIVPSVRGITPQLSKSANDIIFELLVDMEGADQVPAAALSEGTLLTLGLLTAVSSQPGSPLVLIDDLERSLHPKALGNLVAQIRAVQEQRSGLQIVATSHSPYLLDHFRAEEVLLTNCDADGYAVVKSLTEHPEYKEWKGFMATGEFWSSVGEDWLTGEPVQRRRKARAR